MLGSIEAVRLKHLALIELCLRRDDEKLRLPLNVTYELEVQPVVMDPEAGGLSTQSTVPCGLASPGKPLTERTINAPYAGA